MRYLSLGASVGAAMVVAASSVFAQDSKTIAISTIVEVPALIQTRDGAIAALANRGFVAGKNLVVNYQNANGNMPTQQQIAKKFVGENVDAVLAITTPTAQTVATATKEIPIVFASVTDPVKAQLIKGYEPTGTNITGVSDAAPLSEQLKLMKEIVPNLKRVGFIYNPGLDNAISTLEGLEIVAKDANIEIVESPAPTTNEVILAAKKLLGKVEAIYVPNDSTVVSALEAIVKIGQDTKTPVFTGETGGVERGAMAAVGIDYIEVGKVAGNMIADIFEGKKVGEITPVIAHEANTKFMVFLNKKAADAMGVTIPDAVSARATQIIP
ncbi:ABC transporter substrate-binding protein [Ensifer sp. MPMI2T]|nr:ABC transporter substrate-binding protein [Ensifer sp. MPMI2T]